MANHLPDLSRTDLLVQFLSCIHQIFLRYVPFPILIKVLENSHYVLLCIGLAGFSCHQFDELVEGNLSSIVGIED